MGWIIAAAILLLITLALLSFVRLKLVYEDDEFIAEIGYLFIVYKLFPKKQVRVRLRDYSPAALRKKRQAYKKKNKPAERPPDVKKGRASSGTVTSQLRHLFRVVKVVAERTRRHGIIVIKRLKIVIATGDAASTALTYGAVSQLMSYIMAYIENNFRIHYKKDADAGVKADFISAGSYADINIVFRIRLFNLLGLAASGLIENMREN